MLRGVLGGAAVGDHLDGDAVRVLPCVGHRVMVPLAGRPYRIASVLSVNKEWDADAQLRLTVA
ncbi:hypothetical protein GCM10010272_07930 [Streptomyces lateritius]|nr:hypothetical protein GCM10010272_07930 [Streptomyces lateritius]